MLYESTRGACSDYTFERAVISGIAPDGGLFVPDRLPKLGAHDLDTLGVKNYRECAFDLLCRFIPSFTNRDVADCVKAAYGDNFDTADVVPLRRLSDGTLVLELFHGPTAAFKDLALQLLPQLLVKSVAKTGGTKKTMILVATSGDTGKAALEGFCDVPDTKIMIFYPLDGVSEVQERQMTSQRGGNVAVVAVKGNFDDAQTAVKALFADEALGAEAASLGWSFSSANSINWGRLLPQIVYYVYVCAKLSAAGALEGGKKVSFTVPTGNFGNILACWYAKRMGAPIGRIVCASNANDVLTDFLRTGIYDRARPFHKTISPSMDILVSSNLERLLYEAGGHDAARVRGYMEKLRDEGRYTVDAELMSVIGADFSAGCLDDDGTRRAMGRVWDEYGYLCDPHTAVAFGVREQLKGALPANEIPVVVSTASPFKFASDVLRAVGGEAAQGFDALPALARFSLEAVPAPLAGLESRPVLHTDARALDGLRDAVEDFLRK